jgi:Tfp pilus assembly protein PilN
MGSKKVVIGLDADRLVIAVCRGAQVLESRDRVLDRKTDHDSLRTTMQAVRSALDKQVEELNVRGLPCHVYYRSPTCVAEVVSSRTRKTTDARGAAQLAITSAFDCDVDLVTISMAAPVRDRSGGSTHVVAAGDRDDVASLIVETIESCGLRVDGMTPTDTPMIAGLIQSIVSNRDAGIVGRLYLGEETSFFAVGEAGGLRLFRRVGFACRQLAEAMSRIHGADDETIELDLETAQSWLREHGVPDRDEVVDESRGVTGMTLRPLMQPVLQRLVTEVRQSIRFGVDEKQRSAIRIRLDGPGAGIANLAQLLEHELGLEVQGDQTVSDEFGLCVTDATRPRVGILPRAATRRRLVTAVRNRLWIGAAAAGLLLGVDALMLQGRLASVHDAVEPLRMTSDAGARLEQRWRTVFHAAQTSHALENRVAATLGGQPPYAALLRIVPGLLPDSVELLAIRMQRSDGASPASAEIDGLAFTMQGRSTSGLRELIDALSELPVIESVELASVHDVEMDGGSAQQFRLALGLTAMPATLESGRMAELAAVGTGGER